MTVFDRRAKYSEIVARTLDKLKLSDTVEYAVEGPCYVPSQQGVTVGWILLVTLKHNMLLGQDDIGVSVPVAGVLPPEKVFEDGAKIVLEKARELRHEENTKVPGDQQQTAPGALSGVGNGLPTGLVGKGFGGGAVQRGSQ